MSTGLAKSFEKTIHQQLNVHAAWVPIINTFKVGDFGIMSDGVFTPLGNVKDKFPDINLVTGNSNPAEIDFKSSSTRVLKFDASGKAVESFAALGNAQASLKFVFDSANSHVIKAKMSTVELKNIHDVASFLARKNGWERRLIVVSKIYNGEKCVVINSRDAGTEIEIKASADILRQIELGNAAAGLEIKSNKESDLTTVGDSGVIALELFKLNLFNRVKILAGEEVGGDQLVVPVGDDEPDTF